MISKFHFILLLIVLLVYTSATIKILIFYIIHLLSTIYNCYRNVHYYNILYFSGNMKTCQEKNRTTENTETQVHKSQEHQLQVKRKKVKKFYKTLFEFIFNFDFAFSEVIILISNP